MHNHYWFGNTGTVLDTADESSPFFFTGTASLFLPAPLPALAVFCPPCFALYGTVWLAPSAELHRTEVVCISSSEWTFRGPFLQVKTVREAFKRHTTHSVTLVANISLSVIVTKFSCHRSLMHLSPSLIHTEQTHTRTHADVTAITSNIILENFMRQYPNPPNLRNYFTKYWHN